MRVWVLTYNDGDYYSQTDEFISVHATKESAKAAGTALANDHRTQRIRWNTHPSEQGPVGEWVLTHVANRFSIPYADPEAAELHYRNASWYVTPEEVQE